MEIKEMLQAIKETKNLSPSDGEIAQRLREMGAKATQSTVWRLRTGAYHRTSFELGRAIERLYNEITNNPV